MVRDISGRFPQRPHYLQEELDRECELIVSAFLRERRGAVSPPITTDELSFNRWATDVFATATWLDPALGLDVSGAVGVTFNGENPATNYETGTEFHLEWAASRIFSPQFNVGLVGYYYNQLTGDSGAGARLGDFEGEVAAVGGTLGYNFQIGKLPVSTRVKYYHEFDVTNRLEGDSGFFTVAVPLWVAPPPAQ